MLMIEKKYKTSQNYLELEIPIIFVKHVYM